MSLRPGIRLGPYEIVSLLGQGEKPPAPLSRLRPVAPRALDAIVAAAMAKPPDERWQAAGDLGIALRTIQQTTTEDTDVSKPRPARWGWIPWATAAGALIFAGALRLNGPRPPVESPPPARFRLEVPSGNAGFNFRVALSPDGRRIVSSSSRGLESRALDQTEFQTIYDQYGAIPFFVFSPDGQWIALQDRSQLKRIRSDGGAAETICELRAVILGGSWTADGNIIFSFGNEILRVPARGPFDDQTPADRPQWCGQRFVVIEETETAVIEILQNWPALLPSGARR